MQKEIGATIRRIRRRNDITLDVLANRTGLSKGYLSRLERGLKSPPISTLSNIAGALGIEIAAFFQQPGNQPNISIVRSDERMQITRDGSAFGYYYEAIADQYPSKSVEPFIITMTPHAKEAELFSHEGEEMIFVLEGKISFTFGDEVFRCEVGDCLYFDSSIKHRCDCLDSKEAKALAVIIPKRKTQVE
jgi:transcriptional regulator with XRE-family HTH domain